MEVLEVYQVLLVLGLCGVALSQSRVEESEDGTSGTISFKTPDLNDEEAHSPWVPDQLKCDACIGVAFQLWTKFDKYNSLHKYRKYDLPESDLLELTEEVCEDTELWNRASVGRMNRRTNLWAGFTDFNYKRKSFRYKVPESEVLQLSESICSTQGAWEAYGIKNVKKVQRLSGPGTETAEIPGVTAGGGKWPDSYGIKNVQKVNMLTGPGLEAADAPGVIAGGGKWPGRLRDMCDQFMGQIGEMTIYQVYKKNPKSRRRLEDFLCRGSGIRGDCRKLEEQQKKDSPPKSKSDDDGDGDEDDDGYVIRDEF